MAVSEKSENTPKKSIWQELATRPRRHWLEVILGCCSFCDFYIFGEGEPTCPDCAEKSVYMGVCEGIWFEDVPTPKKGRKRASKSTSKSASGGSGK